MIILISFIHNILQCLQGLNTRSFYNSFSNWNSNISLFSLGVESLREQTGRSSRGLAFDRRKEGSACSPGRSRLLSYVLDGGIINYELLFHCQMLCSEYGQRPIAAVGPVAVTVISTTAAIASAFIFSNTSSMEKF